MHVRLLVVGDRQPTWVDLAYNEYARRLPRQWKFDLKAIPATRRGNNAQNATNAEGTKLLGAIKSSELVVLLDQTGSVLSSRELSSKLDRWSESGRDLCFVIGGPDGVSAECADRADFSLSLSRMTLPHGLARVMLVEQLFRAWSLTQGHPYHRG